MVKQIMSLAALLCIGCATMRQPLNNFDLQSGNVNNSAYLAGSYVRTYFVIMRHFTGPEFKIRLQKLNDDGTIEKTFSFIQTLDLTGEKKLFLFSLDPGKYRIIDIVSGFYVKHENMTFTAEKGGVIYLGNFVFSRDASLNIVCSRRNGGDDDIRGLKANHPAISGLKFVNMAE